MPYNLNKVVYAYYRSGIGWRHVVGSLLTVLLITGCNSSSPTPTPKAPDERQNDDNQNDLDIAACTEVFRGGDHDTPVALLNSSNPCDYYFPKSTVFKSSISIEPGTSIIVGQNARISISDGMLDAQGSADQRIVFAGEKPLAGYWQGIHISTNRPARLSYLDIKDAGNNSRAMEYYRAGISVIHSTISLNNVSVSNSFANGVYISGSSTIEQFRDNRFFNNALEGLVLTARLVHKLDLATDYLGGAQPNGIPYVQVKFDGRDMPDDAQWKNLNAPYTMQSLQVEGINLSLAPGTKVALQDTSILIGASVWVHSGATLRLEGTEAAPIEIGSVASISGDWEGIRVYKDSLAVMDHVQIHGAENGVYVNNGTVQISNTNIVNSQNWAIDCLSSSLIGTPTIELGNGVTYSNNRLGEINPDCPL